MDGFSFLGINITACWSLAWKNTERATSSHQSILTWNLLICAFQLFLTDNESLDVWWYSDRSIKVTDEPINQLQSTTSSQTFFVVYSGDLLQRLRLISSRYMLLAQMLTTAAPLLMWGTFILRAGWIKVLRRRCNGCHVHFWISKNSNSRVKVQQNLTHLVSIDFNAKLPF